MKRKPYTVQEKEIFLFIEVGIDVNILGREQPQKCFGLIKFDPHPRRRSFSHDTVDDLFRDADPSEKTQIVIGSIADDIGMIHISVGAENQLAVIFHGVVVFKGIGFEHFGQIGGLHPGPLPAAAEIGIKVGKHLEVLAGLLLKDPCPHVSHNEFQLLK